jgi:predicted nuclease of predicted toxin-antitoxin system
VLVTEDKDFGELVFVRRLPHPCIIRFVNMRVEEKVAAMRELLERHADAMRTGTIIVVTR